MSCQKKIPGGASHQGTEFQEGETCKTAHAPSVTSINKICLIHRFDASQMSLPARVKLS